MRRWLLALSVYAVGVAVGIALGPSRRPAAPEPARTQPVKSARGAGAHSSAPAPGPASGPAPETKIGGKVDLGVLLPGDAVRKLLDLASGEILSKDNGDILEIRAARAEKLAEMLEALDASCLSDEARAMHEAHIARLRECADEAEMYKTIAEKPSPSPSELFAALRLGHMPRIDVKMAESSMSERRIVLALLAMSRGMDIDEAEEFSEDAAAMLEVTAPFNCREPQQIENKVGMAVLDCMEGLL